MNDKEIKLQNINEKSEVLDNLGKSPDALERIEVLRIKQEQDNKAWEEKLNKVLNQNIDLGDKVNELERAKNQLEIEKKAIEKSLWRERTQSSYNQEKELTEGQKIANMTLAIIKQRCQDRYEGGNNK